MASMNNKLALTEVKKAFKTSSVRADENGYTVDIRLGTWTSTKIEKVGKEHLKKKWPLATIKLQKSQLEKILETKLTISGESITCDYYYYNANDLIQQKFSSFGGTSLEICTLAQVITHRISVQEESNDREEVMSAFMPVERQRYSQRAQDGGGGATASDSASPVPAAGVVQESEAEDVPNQGSEGTETPEAEETGEAPAPEEESKATFEPVVRQLYSEQ